MIIVTQVVSLMIRKLRKRNRIESWQRKNPRALKNLSFMLFVLGI